MPRVYFDNTFYNFLDKGWFAPQDVEEFKILSGRKIRSYFSPVNADELLAQWPTDHVAALRMLGIARDLVGFDNVLKQPADLLRDEIVAYAQGLASPPKTMPRSLATFFDRELREVAEGGPGSDQLAAKVAADITTLKDDYKKQMADARDEVLTHMKWNERTPAERKSVPFDEYLAESGPYLAEAFADSVGVGDACRRRGITGLLKRRVVAICVGSQMSWIYSLTVPWAGGIETRETDRSDGYDNWHALEASAADIFVTGDTGLAKNLKRLKIADFTVVTSLRELLDKVQSR